LILSIGFCCANVNGFLFGFVRFVLRAVRPVAKLK